MVWDHEVRGSSPRTPTGSVWCVLNRRHAGVTQLVEFLPSKQAVAGSSPVSRSHSETVSLLAHQKPLRGKQAVMQSASRRFYVAQKGVQRHTASKGAS